MPTSATCSPALANLPAFTVSDEPKIPTGTHGKLTRGQATALWLKLYKNVRTFNSMPYSRYLSECKPDDLTHHLCYLLAKCLEVGCPILFEDGFSHHRREGKMTS